MRAVLAAYYLPGRPADLVGYLRGNGSPGQWRSMASANPPHHQMLILGNTEPTNEEWTAAGVGQRGARFAITTGMLSGFIILYGGFMLRPWGQIHIADNDARTIGFPAALRHWETNTPRNRRRP
jgi:hypothetical protein